MRSPAYRSRDPLARSGKSQRAATHWKRPVAWGIRAYLVLFIAINAYGRLDVLVLQSEEYERLIGGESGCGKFKAYCSWRAFVLDGVPDVILSILAAIAMMWRSLPRRELILGLLAAVVCGYLAWRAYSTHVGVSLS